MLAFDLETTGLDPSQHIITCAGVYDPDNRLERVFIFPKVYFFILGYFMSCRDEGDFIILIYIFPQGDDPEDFMVLLDQADRLCSFNGVRFDIPFIQKCFNVPASRISNWRRKLHDIFEGCKLSLNVTFPLPLKVNNLPGKNGNGSDAILLAKNQEWDKLCEYCLNDTKMTHIVSSLPVILIPRTTGLYMNVRGGISKYT